MIVHIVVFTWKDGVTSTDVDALRAAIDAMLPQLGDVQSFRHGPDLKIRPGNGDYALVATFADEEAWRGYQNHPAHKALVTDVVAPLRKGSVATQIAA